MITGICVSVEIRRRRTKMKDSKSSGGTGTVKKAAAKTTRAKAPAKAAKAAPKKPAKAAKAGAAKPAKKAPAQAAAKAAKVSAKEKAPKAEAAPKKSAAGRKSGTAVKAGAAKPAVKPAKKTSAKTKTPVKDKAAKDKAAPKKPGKAGKAGVKPAKKAPAKAAKVSAKEKAPRAKAAPKRSAAAEKNAAVKAKRGRKPSLPAADTAEDRKLSFSFSSCKSTELKFHRVTAALPRENCIFILEDMKILSAWDMSDPREIKKLSGLSLDRSAFKMKIFGDTLYVIRKPHWFNFKGLYYIDVIDISNPAAMTVKERIPLSFKASSLCVDRDGSLLVAGDDGIHRIKAGVSSLLHPFVEDLHIESEYVDIAVRDSICYVAGNNEVGMYIFKIQADGAFLPLKHVPTLDYLFTDAPIHFHKDGKYIQFVRDESFVMVDVTDPGNANRLNAAKIPGVKLCGEFVYTGTEVWLFGLSRGAEQTILAVTELRDTGPALKEKIELPGYESKRGGIDSPRSLFRRGDFLFVFTARRNLGLFEITGPAAKLEPPARRGAKPSPRMK
jgi:hypothetical protein